VRRASVAFFVLAAAIGWPNQSVVLAHAALRLASPLEGATLGDTPAAVQLSFREKPEPSLSVIRVLDTAGASHQLGRPLPVAGDPLSLTIPVRHLDRGIYLVSWRILSAVDGHATAGVYAFGVLMSPAGTAAPPVTYPAASWLEILARWLFIVGLVGLLGASSAGIGEFGESRELLVSSGAWLLSAIGLLLLADAQRRNAAASFADLLNTSIGRALVWRTLSLGAAGVALILTRWSGPRMRRVALAGVALAALTAMAVHVEAGHAAAGRWTKTTTVGVQFAHFAAVGVWLGGLAALLVAVRGTPSAPKTAAVRRFSTIAAAGLFVVAGTGIVRAVGELSSWADLSSTAYGRLLSVKIALLLVIAALGALNRWKSVPAAAISLHALRQTAGWELAVAILVLAATAILGTLPPPAAGPLAMPPGISTSGADFAQSVRVELTAASDQPGANRFVVRAVDYDSKTPVRAKRMSLRFTPLDDPGDESTSLALAPGPDDSYVGSGANMAFDGRWRVTVLIERAADSTEVPLELETRIAPRFVTVERMPDQTTRYTVELLGAGVVQFSADPQRAGPGKLFVSCFDFIGDPLRIESMIVTSRTAGPAHPLLVRRLAGGRFVADIDLQAGRNTIGAVARTSEGARLRAVITIDVTAR
jgi:copper transport protein